VNVPRHTNKVHHRDNIENEAAVATTRMGGTRIPSAMGPVLFPKSVKPTQTHLKALMHLDAQYPWTHL
jgi:hypothetical protein